MTKNKADAKMDARMLLEAARRAGLRSDPEAIKTQIEQLQRGLPAEDEFAALCVWSGRCRLIHRLDQEQFPSPSKAEFQVPDFLALFDVEGQLLPALIEVKATNSDVLKFPAAYHRRLTSYASAASLPLLVGWRQAYGIWTLFDIAEMVQGQGGRWTADFHEVVKQTLMSVVLGDFMIHVNAGAGLTIRVREDRWLSKSRFIGTVVSAYWHDGYGNAVPDLAGTFMPILLSCPAEDSATREQGIITQEFYVPTETGVIAQRTMLASLIAAEEPNWLAILRSRSLMGGRDLVRRAAVDAMDRGMVKWILDIVPHRLPKFLPGAARRESKSTPTASV